MFDDGVDEVAVVGKVVGRRLGHAVVLARPARGRVQPEDGLEAKLVDQVDALVVLLPRGLIELGVDVLALAFGLDFEPRNLLLDEADAGVLDHLQLAPHLPLLDFAIQEDVDAVGVDVGEGDLAERLGLGALAASREEDGERGEGDKEPAGEPHRQLNSKVE
jgi:hypothetical protein